MPIIVFFVTIFSTLFTVFPLSVFSLACAYPGLACNTGLGPGGNESDCPIGQKCVTIDLCGDGSCPTNECVACDASPTCLPQGAVCDQTSTCCIGLCQSGLCSCVPNNGNCSSNNECCGGICDAGTCTEPGFNCLVNKQGSCVPATNCPAPQINEGPVDCPTNYVCCRDRSHYDNLVYCTTTTGKPGISTALGCIPYESNSFVSAALVWSVGVGGGISLIIILWGAVLWITSIGDPKKIQAGQEMITAAISGMIMMIICVLLINYLGDKVLNLGALGFRQ